MPLPLIASEIRTYTAYNIRTYRNPHNAALSSICGLSKDCEGMGRARGAGATAVAKRNLSRQPVTAWPRRERSDREARPERPRVPCVARKYLFERVVLQLVSINITPLRHMFLDIFLSI